MHRIAFVLVALLGTVTTVRADDIDPLYTCKVPAAGTKLAVSLRPEIALQDLAVWVTSFTCKNVVFSADVPEHATKVTVISPTTMTAKQALALFVDAVEATGLVVQIKPDTIIIKLGPTMPRGCPDTKVSSTGVNRELGNNPFAEKPLDGDADMQAAIDKGIKKIDATHYELSASTMDEILANPMAVAKGVRVVPAVKNGKPDGFKLYAIRPASAWGKLGFHNGDTIHSINRMPLDSADKALEIYTKLRDATNLDVAITRQGKPMTISIKIKR